MHPSVSTVQALLRLPSSRQDTAVGEADSGYETRWSHARAGQPKLIGEDPLELSLAKIEPFA